MLDTAPSIARIIESGRWRRAIFTSFTLSLTYFECYILPRLRAKGCGKIDIYVDALGYRDSLTEQRSRHAGRDYTVHPVVVRNGIFHPKLIHLWSENGDDDVLMVGSGNLTYSGHGGNLEVFEILYPAHHATAYAQAATFFGDLATGKRANLNLGDSHPPLESLQRRMAALAEKYPNTQDVQFIHSLHESGLEQITRVLAGNQVDELLVMSPYHHPDAAPIRQLVDIARPGSLLVGLDLRSKTSPFPFERNAEWPCAVKAVATEAAQGRFVHAKWYEWRGPDRVTTFTGSFNATAESLTTCNNVECGVLRQGAPSSDGWFEVEQPPPFQKQVFPRIGPSGELLAAATLTGQRLEGRLLGYTASAPADWTFNLQSGDNAPTTSQQVRIEVDGAFQVDLATRIDAATVSALQIHLESGSRMARGWVALPHILNIPAQRRTLIAALADVDRGSESAASFASFLAIVMDEIKSFNVSGPPSHQLSPSDALPAQSVSLAGARTTDEKDVLAVTPRDVITDGPAYCYATPRDRLLAALASGQEGWAVWGHLGEVLLGPAGKSQPALTTPGTSAAHISVAPIIHATADPDIDPNVLQKDQDLLLASLASFNALIAHCRAELQKRLRSNLPVDERQDVLLNLAHLERTWLHVVLRAYVGPFSDVAGAIYELTEWLHTTVDIPFSGVAFDTIVMEVSGCAAVLAHQNAATPGAFVDALAMRCTPAKVTRAAQYLETFFNGLPDVDRTLEQAAAWLDSQVGHELVGRDIERALTALRVVLEQATPRALVARLMREKPTAVDPAAWRPLSEDKLKLLHKATSSASASTRYTKVDVRDVQSCSVCRHTLLVVMPGRDERRPDPTTLAELKLYAIAPCPRCGAALINRAALSE